MPKPKYEETKVVDIMTKTPITVTLGDTIGQADEIMAENRIRQLPVVRGRELLGIITDRDIRSFLSGSSSELATRERVLNTSVGDIMTTDPITLAPDDDLEDAVELLIEEKIGGIPVVDDTEGLIGIITYVDALRCFLNALQSD
ncbi:MAG TPA: CBS domain-containing protein [Candidatus Binatia bacterium]|jgi:acetoin utilization protein AcuB